MFNTMGNPLKVVSDLREEVEQHRRHAEDLQATIDALTEELKSRDALISQQETKLEEYESQLCSRLDRLSALRGLNTTLHLDLLKARSTIYRLEHRGLFARIFNRGVA